MNNKYQQTTRCSACGELFPLNHVGPCPKCGDTRKTHDLHIWDTIRLNDSFAWQHIREYYERHWVPLLLVFAITVGSPFLGLVLAGGLGVVVGLVIGVVTFVFGLLAVAKVREIQKGPKP